MSWPFGGVKESAKGITDTYAGTMDQYGNPLWEVAKGSLRDAEKGSNPVVKDSVEGFLDAYRGTESMEEGVQETLGNYYPYQGKPPLPSGSIVDEGRRTFLRLLGYASVAICGTVVIGKYYNSIKDFFSGLFGEDEETEIKYITPKDPVGTVGRVKGFVSWATIICLELDEKINRDELGEEYKKEVIGEDLTYAKDIFKFNGPFTENYCIKTGDGICDYEPKPEYKNKKDFDGIEYLARRDCMIREDIGDKRIYTPFIFVDLKVRKEDVHFNEQGEERGGIILPGSPGLGFNYKDIHGTSSPLVYYERFKFLGEIYLIKKKDVPFQFVFE